jgi:presenilin-like A22 family membrane protease
MRERIGITMSDEEAGWQNRRVSQRFAEVEDELRAGESLASLMAEQWRGMAGMAGMFIATIALAMYIRPYYDVGELHAFGASGATQVRYVAVELIAIFAFTALIIFLARWGKEFIIKYGMYAVLSLAMLYTMVPLAHMLVLDFDPEPFTITDESTLEGDLLGTWGNDGFILATVQPADTNSTVVISAWDASNNYAAPVWSLTHDHNIHDATAKVTMTASPGALSFASGDYTWRVDSATGELLASYACYEWQGSEAFYFGNLNGGCQVAVPTEESLYLVNRGNELVRFVTFEDQPDAIAQQGGRWLLPGFSIEDGVLSSTVLDNDEWFFVTPGQAAAVLLEESSGGIGMGQGAQVNATYLYDLLPEEEATFTSADVGYSPFSELNHTELNATPETRAQRMVLMGESAGRVTGVEWNGSAPTSSYTVQDRMNLNGLVDGVTSVRLTDLDESGYSDLLVSDGSNAHWLYTTALVDRGVFPVASGASAVFFAVHNDTTDLVMLTSDGSNTTVALGELTTEMFPLYGLQLLLGPTLAGVAVTVLLLVLLVVHSEWYVVNTTGVLLGAGVCVMLGVTFVPVLAILFMVLAAVYDFWAVYRSKHMLDLADTMIGLRLPILLVAPQDTDYSLIEETERHKEAAPVAEQATAPSTKPARSARPARKKSEAMFMGLGDVIFPGMLVLSAMQWLDPSVAFEVAMATLVGGLMGYLALMTYVARGQAQAGLPLLNGGAILGYLIGGMWFLGSEILSFNITW